MIFHFLNLQLNVVIFCGRDGGGGGGGVDVGVGGGSIVDSLYGVPVFTSWCSIIPGTVWFIIYNHIIHERRRRLL